MALLYTMGYRKISLFGYDSSFRGEIMHAKPQGRTVQESHSFEVCAYDRKFFTNAAMARQAEIFPVFAQQLTELGVQIDLYGDGLLPHIVQSLTASIEESNHLEKDNGRIPACI